MKISTATRRRIPAMIWDYFAYLTGGQIRDFEDQRKRSVLAFFLLLGIMVASPFAVYHFSIGNIARAIVILCVGSIQLASLIALRFLKQAHLVFRLNVFLLGSYFIFLVFIGGTHGSRLLWAFVFPLFAFYLLGSKEGLLWSLLQFVLIAVLFIAPSEVFGSYPYQAEIKVRFFIIYSLIMLMSYFVELTRKRYQDEMEQARLSLEDKVERRTAELQHANKQLKDEINEREVAVQRHQAAEQEKAIILSSLMEFVLFEDKNMQILWANRAACESVGLSHDEILGRYCYEIWAHREDTCEDCPVQNAIQTGKPHEVEKMTPDGRTWMIRGYPVRDAENQIIGGIEVALEITDRKKAERELKEAYEIVNKSPAVAFLWKNETGWPVEFVTANVEPLLGYTPDDLLSGKVSYVDIVYPDDLDRVAEEVETFSSESERERFSHKPYRLISKDGPVKWIQASTFIRRDQKGNVTHFHGIVEDITEAVDLEAALRESEAMFRTLVENSQAGIFLVDEQYCFAYANEKLSHILGYRQEEIEGLDFRSVLDEESREFVADRSVRRQKGEDVPNRYEVGVVRKNDEKRRLEMVATTIINPNGSRQTMGQVLDITDRKEAERSLRESEERFRELAENIREVFWLFDWEQQRVLYVSPAYEEVWGRSILDLYGHYEEWGNSIHPDDAEYAEASFAKILESGGGEDREYRIVRPDGSVRWVLDRGFAIKGDNGEIKRIAGIAEDITERKKIEEELGRYHQQLQDLVQERTRELEVAQEELLKNERLAVLGQLTATVSHELRNPLGVVRSSAFYLQQKNKEQDPKIIKHINRIEDQVEICDSIVGDLLEYTRGRHSQMVVGEINPWIEQVLDDLPKEIDIRMNIALEANLPRIQFDKEKVRRVMVNLMDNAFQAITERKRVAKDDIFEPGIEVTTQTKDQDIMIRVKDNGIGMDPETMDRAFEPLFTTRARGTGLGLANVKKIIEEHNGSIWLQSKPNRGTAVIITIPAQTEV